MRLMFTIAIWLLGSTLAPAQAGTLDRMEPAPAGWTGPVFEPKFNFPAKIGAQLMPWSTISFRKEPKRYLRTVLHYALEGQDRKHWRLQRNKLRNWYHVPWLGPGANGREFIHGLRRDNDLKPRELSPSQTACRQTWSLAFYNQHGATLLKKIWGRGDRDPNLNMAPFPIGSVAVKLAFTDATPNDDPKLAGAPELTANIHRYATANSQACPPATTPQGNPATRSPQSVRLIQFDIAVREPRASYKTGWVFGSFRYDGSQPGSDPWAKLVPMGLMWGNDPDLSDTDGALRQSIVFKGFENLGRAGRMNGIVDERSSACSSCHMAAQWPAVAPITPPFIWSEARCWFRNIDGRYPFGFPPGQKKGCGDPAALNVITPLDYSLQLTIALRNWSLEKLKQHKTRRTSIGLLARLPNGELAVDGLRVELLER